MPFDNPVPPARLGGDLCPRQATISSLLLQVGDGDRDALAGIYDQLSETVYLMSLGMGHGPQIATEVTHDVLLQVWRQACTYDPGAESAWSWFRAIAVEAIGTRSAHPPLPALVRVGRMPAPDAGDVLGSE